LLNIESISTDSGKAIYTLSIISDEIGEQQMWSVDTSIEDYQGFWQNTSFGIGRRKKPFAIQLSRQTSKTMTETFAIDDVLFSGCEFGPPNQMSNCANDRFLCRHTQACIDMGNNDFSNKLNLNRNLIESNLCLMQSEHT